MNIRLSAMTLSFLIIIMPLAGCIGGDESSESTDTSNSETPLIPVLFEGDEAGECSDGADNDQDGLFDCNDPNCSGSPYCKSLDQETTQTDDNNTHTEENNASTQEWAIVNLTDEMISSGDLDASNCGILLFVNEYDGASTILKNQILIQEFNETPSFDIWIANYEDITGTVILPSLYDWRNGVINTSYSTTIYVIDKDEVVLIGDTFSRETILQNVCLPSERDEMHLLFQTIDPPPPPPPPPVPFNWNLSILTNDKVVEMKNKYDNNDSICEIIALSVSETPKETLEHWHNIMEPAIDEVGETDVNFWFINMTIGSNWNDDMIILKNWTNVSLQDVEFLWGGYFILDNSPELDGFYGTFIPRLSSNGGDPQVYSRIGDACDSNSREDVYHFFHEIGYSPIFDDRYSDHSSININATSDSITQYELIQINESGEYHGIHNDLDLDCYIDTYEYFSVLNITWILNNQSINENVLKLSSYSASLGDEITCILEIYDSLTKTTLTREMSSFVEERQPLVYDVEIITNGENFECNFSILNPNNISYDYLFTWIVDVNNDGETDFSNDWYSTFSDNNTFDPNSPDSNSPEQGSAHLETGDLIACTVDVFTPEDAQYLLQNGFDDYIYSRYLSNAMNETRVQ